MSRRIRILYVVGNFVAGGAERHLVELWQRIDRTAFEVEIACFRREGQFLGEVDALGWPVRELGVGTRIYGPAGVVGLARLARHALDFRPDVIHGYLFGPNLFAAIAGRLAGVPAVIVSKRNVDRFETRRQIAVQRFAHRLATRATAVSEAVADTVVELGVPRDRVVVIPNGVDSRRFGAGVANGDGGAPRNGMPVIGSVGCLAPRKDYGTLLAALGTLKSEGRRFRAMLVGDGPERAQLETLAGSLGLADRVEFLGERPDVERLLPQMDVFALSSREEGIPNALLEAMAAGRPSVATAVGGTPEVLTDGETGWLVPAGDAAALAGALREALEDRAEAGRRGSAARHAVESRMGIDAMVRRYETLYRDVVSERRRG